MKLLTQRQREDVALCAMTMAWCAGLNWNDLHSSAPDGRAWEHDQEAFIQTALVILGHREIHARTYIADAGEIGIRDRRVFVARSESAELAHRLDEEEVDIREALALARALMVEADSAISHLYNRNIWPLDKTETASLIGRLRKESEA